MISKKPNKRLEGQNRRHPRKPVRTNVTYHYENTRLNRMMTGSGFTMNLSKSGAMIRIETYLPPLCEIDLSIQTSDGSQVKTKARVVHCKRVAFNRYDAGVQFINVKKKT